MRKPFVALVASLFSMGAAAQDYLPTASVRLGFGGVARTPEFGLQLAASQLAYDRDDRFRELVAVNFDSRVGTYTSLLGVPKQGWQWALGAVEEGGAGASNTWLWIGGAAVAAAVVMSAGGREGGSGGEDSTACNVVSDETLVGSPEETADPPEVSSCGGDNSGG